MCKFYKIYKLTEASYHSSASTNAHKCIMHTHTHKHARAHTRMHPPTHTHTQTHTPTPPHTPHTHSLHVI